MSSNIEVRISSNAAQATESVRRFSDVLRQMGLIGAQSGDRVKAGSDRTAQGLRSISDQLSRTKTQLIGFFSVRYGVAAAKSVLDLQIKFEQMRSTLKYVKGDFAGADEEMAYASETANRLKINVLTVTDAYSKLLAAAQGTGLAIADIRAIFEGVSEAGVVLGLSNEQLEGSFLAIQQIMSKQKVTAEELRGQLGERMAGVFQAAARATGLSVQDFNKALESGKLNANAFLVALGRQFHEQFGTQVPDAVNGARGALADFENAWLDLKRQFAESGFVDGLTTAMKELSSTMKDDGFKESLRDISSSLGTIIKTIVENKDTILTVLGALYGGRIGAGIGGLVPSPYGKLVGAGIGALAGGLGAAVAVSGGDAGSSASEDRVRSNRIARLRQQIEDLRSGTLVLSRAMLERAGGLDKYIAQQVAMLAELEKAKSTYGSASNPTSGEIVVEGETDKKDAASKNREALQRIKEFYDLLDDEQKRRRAALKEFDAVLEDEIGGGDVIRRMASVNAQLDALRQRLDAEVTIGTKTRTQAQVELREETARLGQTVANDLVPRLQELIQTAPTDADREKWRALLTDIRAMEAAGNNVGWLAGMQAGLQEYAAEASDVFGGVKDATARAFQGMEQSLVDFVQHGKASFSDLVDSIIQDLLRLVVRQSITGPLSQALSGALGGMFGGGSGATWGAGQGIPGTTPDLISAKGNVFGSPGGLHQYVNQIHNTPKVFAFARGGVFAEAGPEAVMPLGRDSSGRLGVRASGGNTSVEVHNYTGQPGTTRESVDSRGNRRVEVILGEMVAAELRRPGSAAHSAMRAGFGAQPVMVGR